MLKFVFRIAGFSPFQTQLFSKVVACVSNINNSDLQALWAMITYYGGSFQLHLNNSCTHLISTKPVGEKYERSIQNTNIAIVTPDWVVESIKEKKLCDVEAYHPKLLILPVVSKQDVSPDELASSILMSVSNANNNVQPPTSGQQVFLRTVSLPSAQMVTTAVPAQASIGQSAQSSVQVQGNRLRVFLPPQRLMQMQNQQNIRQLRPQLTQQIQSQVMQQTIQRQMPPGNSDNASQQQLQPQQQQIEQWNLNNNQTVGQFTPSGQIPRAIVSQPIQVVQQRPISGGQLSQQQQPPRQVYLAVQQQQVRQQQFLQVRQQQFISVQQSQQSQQNSNAPPNIIIQQRSQVPGQMPQRMQQGQQLIQLQQRQQFTLQQQNQGIMRVPQQIIIQQQNQQGHIQRQLQLQQQQQPPPQQPQGVQVFAFPGSCDHLCMLLCIARLHLNGLE